MCRDGYYMAIMLDHTSLWNNLLPFCPTLRHLQLDFAGVFFCLQTPYFAKEPKRYLLCQIKKNTISNEQKRAVDVSKWDKETAKLYLNDMPTGTS